MELKVRTGKWSAGVPVVMLRKSTAQKLGIYSKQRIILKTSKSNHNGMSALADIFDTKVKEGEIITSDEVTHELNLKSGDVVSVSISPPPTSIKYIKEKLEGKVLSRKKIRKIIEELVDNSLSEPEVTLFVSAVHQRGMNFKETISLIKAILYSGKTLSPKGKLIADKHSIGGIPGNRTTPIVISICAANGLVLPKTSSRAITSAAGTADTMETIAKVDFDMERVRKIIEETGACLVWGGSLGMVPADSKIIAIEKELRIDSESQMLASIMAKKLAAGSKYLIIDIPYGKTAKTTLKKAERVKLKFERLCKYFGIKAKVFLTPAKEPIGNGIGPALEIKDVIAVLDQEKEGPKDLEEKSLFLAGELLELTRKAKKGKGYDLAKSTLDSGEAFKKFKEIIIAQEGSLAPLREAKYKRDIFSKRNGKVRKIDNKKINDLARTAGCPLDKFSGVYLHKHLGNKVKKGEKILTIYAESRPRLNNAIKFYEKEKPFSF